MTLTYLRRELLGRRKAHLVIAAGLALGIALVLIVDSVSSGMRKAQDEVLESLYGLGTDLTVSASFEPEEGGGGTIRRPRFDFDAREDEEQSGDMLVPDSPATLDAAAVERVAGMDDVAGAAGGLGLRNIGVMGSFQRGQVPEDGSRDTVTDPGEAPRVEGGGAEFDVDQYSVFGADVTRPDLGPLSTVEVTEGRTFEADETDAAVALLDADHAAENDLAVGDTLTTAGTDIEVIGLTSPTTEESTTDVFIPLTLAQRLSGLDDEVTGIYVQAADSQHLDAIESAITDQVDDAEVTTAADLADQVSGSLSTAADLADGVGTWLSYLVLASAFLVAGLLASSSVNRRVREFGTLKALGWTRGRVTRQVMSESLVTGLVGGALGLGAGLACAWTITRVRPDLTAELGLGAFGDGPVLRGPGGGQGPEAPAGGTGPSLDIGLTAPVGLDILTLAVALAVTGGLVAGAFAAWRAARLRPADALRRIA
ncbi:ABC transporter permease [Streptomyces sp. SBT349]|uniref:ABC transporter permease n=1 Tax=Streptomyces sp. SBT349 TaxID=1580539 RepID=UPI00066E4622|nr:ABC transporter permease [Streptomyces sp. SBT349]